MALWFTAGDPAAWFERSLVERVSRLAVVVAAGAGAYFATLWLTGIRLKDFVHRAPT